MNNNLRIKKVPLETFLDILSDLFDKGVDYVDIAGTDEENGITISFCKEYMSEEFAENFDAIPTTTKSSEEININLPSDSDVDDLNDLI
jgi:hypothetical protein